MKDRRPDEIESRSTSRRPASSARIQKGHSRGQNSQTRTSLCTNFYRNRHHDSVGRTMQRSVGKRCGCTFCTGDPSRIPWLARANRRPVGFHDERSGIRYWSSRLYGNHHAPRQWRTRFAHEQRQWHEYANRAGWYTADGCDAKMNEWHDVRAGSIGCTSKCAAH